MELPSLLAFLVNIWLQLMKLTARNALAYRTYVRTKEDEERRRKLKKN
jgi:hypothetical protein